MPGHQNHVSISPSFENVLLIRHLIDEVVSDSGGCMEKNITMIHTSDKCRTYNIIYLYIFCCHSIISKNNNSNGHVADNVCEYILGIKIGSPMTRLVALRSLLTH